jgi:arginase family enzyme
VSRATSVSIAAAASDNDSSASNTAEGVTIRKRKRSHDEMKEFKTEIMEMFSLWKIEQNKNMSVLLDTINLIKEQNEDIRTSIDFMSKSYDEVLQRN